MSGNSKLPSRHSRDSRQDVPHSGPDNPALLHHRPLSPPSAGTTGPTGITHTSARLGSLHLHSAVKRPGRSLRATSVPGPSSCRLLHVTENTNKLTFLVDTDAQVSVLPPTQANRLRPQTGFNLSAVNGTAIETYGTRSLTLNLGLRQTFRWIFVVANVQKPLLVADFLHHFDLLVDISHGKLVDTHTHLNIQCILTDECSPTPTLPKTSTHNPYLALLSEYPDLSKVHNYHDTPVCHDVTHHLRSTCLLPCPSPLPRTTQGRTT